MILRRQTCVCFHGLKNYLDKIQMSGTCINTTYMDGKISSIRETSYADWKVGADIKSKNWQEKGGYRSVYKCGDK